MGHEKIKYIQLIHSLSHPFLLVWTFKTEWPFDNLFEICDRNHDVGYKVMKNIANIITKHLIKSNHKLLKLTTAISLLIDN